MKVEDVKKVGVIGAGTIGTTIAATMAVKYGTVVKEATKGLADKGMKGIINCFPTLVRRSVITEVEKEISISRISMTTDFEPFKDCQLVVEAVPDDLKLKTEVLSELNKVCPPSTVLTTTSSLMSITALAAGCGRPDRMIGTHFNNPAHLMALVEVAPALQTSDETINFTMEFLSKGLGKTAIKCKDRPGFIVNYLFFPYLVSAIKAYDAGLATIEEIDTAIKLGLGHPMGPFELLDMFGLDAIPNSFGGMYDQLKDERFAPPPLVMKMIEAGHWGRKTRQGFYKYDEKGKKIGPSM